MTETISPEEFVEVASALDGLKRQTVADMLDQLALSGWVLYHVELDKSVSPSALARRVERGHSHPLVAPGDRGTVDPSPTPPHPEGDDPHDPSGPVEVAFDGQPDLQEVPALPAD